MAVDAAFRPSLIVVDFQEDFCPPDGALAVGGGRDLIETINDIIQLPFELKVATQDWHPPNHISFASNHASPDNKPFESFALIRNPLNPSEKFNTRLWPVHCVQGQPGAELVSGLDVQRFDHIVKKGTDPRVEMYSAFMDQFKNPIVSISGLDDLLAQARTSHVYVVGLAMDYCVKHTALDAARKGYRTYVIAQATKAVDPSETGWGAAQAELERAGVELIDLSGAEMERVRLRQAPITS
ncbi:MAG: hypothetical protein M1825_002972 [Sarcosagium campestre]|nr:MAG: hypothetical protein M1825_002972 [Sarcosagium campestre]